MKVERGLLFFAGLISQICLYLSQGDRYTFRCRNNIYIRDGYFCDSANQCPGGEDEGLGCSFEGNRPCSSGKFACDGGQCQNLNVRCNTIQDCKDGTDELNCGDEIKVKNCISENKFLCNDGLRCLELDLTCDGYCHCFDCSDENNNCSEEDHDLLKKCPHAYFVTAKGPQCFCELTNSSSSILCDSVAYCHPKRFKQAYREYPCEQRCIQFNKITHCSCYEGYEPITGTFGSRCRSTDQSVILYSNGLEIKSTNNVSLETSTIVRGIANCTLLTAANNFVYYATSSRNDEGNIFKVALNSGKPEKLIETNFIITSMAVDYITNNIYIAGNGSLSVCTNNGQICTKLKRYNVNSVALAPKSGWMFYMLKQTLSDVVLCSDGYFLTKSNMDGSNEHVRTSHCYNGEIFIDMDESKSMLYVLERLDKQETTIYKIFVDFLFENQYETSTLTNLPKHIQHFSVYNDEIFFTRHAMDRIFYMPTIEVDFFSTGRKPIVFLNESSTSSITDLFVHNAAIQRSIENPCNKSACSGLCLIKPHTKPSNPFLAHACLCDRFNSTADNHWCSDISEQSAASYPTLWTICILVMLILLVIGSGLYWVKRRHWRRRLKLEADQNEVSFENYSTQL